MKPQLKRLLTSLILGIILLLGSLLVLDMIHSSLAQASTTRYAVVVPMDGNDRSGLSATINQGQIQKLSNFISVNSIWIDDKRKGWDQTEAYNPNDPPNDNGGTGYLDWITVTMAHDCSHLYVRYEVNDGPPVSTDNGRYNLLVDIDRNRDTGFYGWGNSFSIGADVLVQGATVFTFVGANQEYWAWNLIQGYDFDDQPLSGSKRDIEYKIPISDLDVFGVTSFDWIVWADHTFTSTTVTSSIPITDTDFYPDGGYMGGDFNTYTFDYTRPTSLFPNPERGLLRQTNTHDPYTDTTLARYQPLATYPGTSTLRCYREYDGITLIHRNFWLSEFVTSTISNAYTTAMQADFDTVREAGLKMIVRFAYTPVYTDPITCAGESDLYDASKEWILTHTRQLSDVLWANSDVIAAVQAGFIGGWGEWWGSCQFPDLECGCCPDDAAWDDRRDVLFAILDTLPATRMVQLRTPRYKYNIFSDTVICSDCIPQVLTPLNESQAHTGIPVARTGHHNDCFLCNPTDAGTYVYTPTEYDYLQQETKYVVMGGETGDFNQIIPPFDPSRLKCETALEELDRFHWSFLSIDWYSGTHEIWRNGGCFDEIEQKLGYRFGFLSLDYSEQITVGQNLTLSLQITNEGYAAPYNPRPVELVLRHTNDFTHTFILYDPTKPKDRLRDPRFWLPGITHTISYTVGIPCLPPGSYELLLNLPDPEPELRYRPEYAIRLAGAVWEENTGYNKLNHTVTVGGHCIYLPLILKNDG